MSSQFGAGTLVEYAGSQWRVQRALGVEAVLLRSDSGDEVAADPLKLRRPGATTLALSPVPGPPIDELRCSEADWAEATRRRDLLGTLASKQSRTTADVTAAAAALDLTLAPGMGLAAPVEDAGRRDRPLPPGTVGQAQGTAGWWHRGDHLEHVPFALAHCTCSSLCLGEHYSDHGKDSHAILIHRPQTGLEGTFTSGTSVRAPANRAT